VHGNGAAAAGRHGKSIKRGIPHTTGIHRIVVDQKKEKKVRKKGSTTCPLKKVRSESSPKVAPFFNRGIKGHYPNDRLLVQKVHTTFWRRTKKKEKKGKNVR
jgi:hypothetical protein